MRLYLQVSRGKLWAFGIAILTVLVMGCADNTDDSPTTDIRVMESELGEILTDVNGRSLYIFAGDAAGRSTCEGSCLDVFTVFAIEDFTLPEGIPAEYFGTVTRNDGGVQVTYKGWPLYHFTYDSRIGDVEGDGKEGTWFVAKTDYDLMLAQQTVDGDVTRYLVDSFGNSLYHWTNDNNNQSNCMGGCLTARPLFSSPEPVLPSVLENGDFREIVTNNMPQTTFKQKPLYYFVNDSDRGDTNGHGTNGEWFLEDIQ
jgi:predicted lipoprotein with Yx(FWY)xxD motif